MKWIKPSGAEVTTGDDEATIDYLTSLGWKKAKRKYTKKEKPEAIADEAVVEFEEVA